MQLLQWKALRYTTIAQTFCRRCIHLTGSMRVTVDSLATFLLTISTEQSRSGEAKSYPACEESPHILLNPNVRYRVHNSLSPVPKLSQKNPVLPSCFFKLRFNNTLSITTPLSSKWPLYFRFPHKSCACLLFPIRTTSTPPHPPDVISQHLQFDHPYQMWRTVQIMKLLTM